MQTSLQRMCKYCFIGLEYMHSKQILHRDLKTQNILLNKKRTIVKLSDFGISKELSTRSLASTVVGTPNYLSPEICEGFVFVIHNDVPKDPSSMAVILEHPDPKKGGELDVDSMPLATLFEQSVRGIPAVDS
uniref:non-specific serine/threonine protein kinase n=1 Tax=Parascaris equorum TaxID=6256 RepID=A0A914R1S1_PAREQ